jgi:polyisoprenyl-phosphate glycosyltransferase
MGIPIVAVELSVVVAVYNEHPRNLLTLLERLWKALSAMSLSYEVVFVDDGSQPTTSQALKQLAAELEYVKLVVLSRNFGQQAAISAGLANSAGKAVVNIDSDCQDPPELIPRMVELWKQGFDVVYAQRSTRRDRFAKRASAYLFYRLLGCMSSVEIPWDTGDFRLMDRRVVDVLAALPEKTRFLRGLIPWLGFKQTAIAVDREAREVGQSTYTVRKLLRLATDGLLSFSAAPLYAVPALGALLAVSAVLGFMARLLAGPLQLDNSILLLALTLFSGLQLLGAGIVAVYLCKVLDEVRGRPTFIVSQKLGQAFDSEVTSIEESEPVACAEAKQKQAVTSDS